MSICHAALADAVATSGSEVWTSAPRGLSHSRSPGFLLPHRARNSNTLHSSFPPPSAPPPCTSSGAPHTDIYLTYEQIAALPEEKRTKWLSLAYQVDSNLMCGFDPEREPIYEELIEDYINHSCAGNSWYEGDDLLVAMRDIKAGEEIYYDYALTENHPDFSFPKCLCPAANCRGRITGNDWMIPELQEKYGRHFLPHVLRSIDELKEKQAKEAAAAAAAGSASSPAASAEAATATQ